MSAIGTITETLVAARRAQRPAPSSGLATALQGAAEAYVVQDAVAQAMGWFDRAVPRY